MPEGHTIHRVARDHGGWFVGQTLRATSPQGRFSEGAERLDGKRLDAVEAYGKHLFYRWSGRPKPVLHVHLGLYGKFRVHSLGKANEAPPAPRGAVRLRVVGSERAFDLNGPNCCELLDRDGVAAILARLGPDPLRPDADPERAWDRIRTSRVAIGGLLLNQQVIAGVGNIYRCEALHLLGVHPRRLGRDLDRREFDWLWEKLVELLEVGVKHNRIIVSDPAVVGKPRSRMTRDERLRVYKKQTCPDCGASIEEFVQAARKMFACNRCQS
ncbi:MAG: Fpg/Nei family DNA glycosylase [Lacipirellulaceae bacterium]